MKTILLFIILTSVLFSCKEEEKTTEEKKDTTETAMPEEEELIEIKDGLFTEYYPGRKAIKFQGRQDKDGYRDGIWLFYSETGIELSMTNYENGVRQGHSIVKYPSGAIHYTGEYKNDKPSGIWKTYDTQGKLVNTKDYDKI